MSAQAEQTRKNYIQNLIDVVGSDANTKAIVCRLGSPSRTQPRNTAAAVVTRPKTGRKMTRQKKRG